MSGSIAQKATLIVGKEVLDLALKVSEEVSPTASGEITTGATQYHITRSSDSKSVSIEVVRPGGDNESYSIDCKDSECVFNYKGRLQNLGLKAKKATVAQCVDHLHRLQWLRKAA